MSTLEIYKIAQRLRQRIDTLEGRELIETALILEAFQEYLRTCGKLPIDKEIKKDNMKLERSIKNTKQKKP